MTNHPSREEMADAAARLDALEALHTREAGEAKPASAGTHRAAHSTGPSQAHLDAVALAIQKFTGAGEFAAFTTPRVLPPHIIVWDDREIFGHPTRLAATGVHRDGQVAIYLRSDLSPSTVHRNMLHELDHAHCHRFARRITGPSEWHEHRAIETASRLAWL
jgi:hypothetical protein